MRSHIFNYTFYRGVLVSRADYEDIKIPVTDALRAAMNGRAAAVKHAIVVDQAEAASLLLSPLLQDSAWVHLLDLEEAISYLKLLIERSDWDELATTDYMLPCSRDIAYVLKALENARDQGIRALGEPK